MIMKVLLGLFCALLALIQASNSMENYESYKKSVNEHMCQKDKITDDTIDKYTKCKADNKLYQDDLKLETKKEHNRAMDECVELLSKKVSTYSGVTGKHGKYVLMTHCFTDEYEECYYDKINKFFNQWLNDTMTEFKTMRNCQLSAVGSKPSQD